jgi:hypothetical protein
VATAVLTETLSWTTIAMGFSMAAPDAGTVRERLRAELATTRSDFHRLLQALSEEEWRRQSKNPGWTNGQILFHMTFGFMILRSLIPLVRVFGRLPEQYSKLFSNALDASTPLFNRVNAFGARGGGTIFGRRRLGKRFESTYRSLLRTLDTIGDDEWGKGMHYPTRWDSLFDEYMTLEKLFHYPTVHFRFHRDQLTR